MADTLAGALRTRLSGIEGVTETRMFGGDCFMLNGNMLLVARRQGGLLVRVGAEKADAAVGQTGVERMVMNGRSLADYVTVDAAVIDAAAIDGWIVHAIAFVRSLPPKKPAKPGSRRRRSAS